MLSILHMVSYLNISMTHLHKNYHYLYFPNVYIRRLKTFTTGPQIGRRVRESRGSFLPIEILGPVPGE